MPKLADNWGQYRAIFGGQLKGWSTSYFNQLEEIKSDLEGHQKDVEKLLKAVSNKKTPRRDGQRCFSQLEQAFKSISEFFWSK